MTAAGIFGTYLPPYYDLLTHTPGYEQASCSRKLVP